jgi:NADPH-ferrihemoprotein reductase
LEAKPLLAAGKADDSMGTTEEDFMEWKETLFSVFRDDLGCDERPKQYEPKMRVVQDNSLDVIDLHIGQPLPPKNAKKTAMMSSSIQALTVKITKRLLSTADRNYIHLELDTSEYPELKYKTGDHLAIWPSNPISEADRLIKVLGLENQRQIPLLISSLDPSIQTKVPSPTTIEALFGYYLEICAPVRREVVLSLAQYAPTIAAKMRLIQLGEDKDIYSAFCSSTNITFGRLLESVTQPGNSWANLPLSFVLESLCCLSPRYYSISSSSVVHPKQIAITVATSTFNTSKQPILGLTTSYLSDVEQSRNSSGSQTPSAFILDGSNNVLEHGKVFAHIRKSKFRLPVLAKNPIIMVASGSGIAPFRGFLQERARLASIGRDVGPSILFFGCRRADEDYLYYKELQQLNESLGERMEVNTAFSRQDVNKRGGKMYVQDRIEEHYRMLLRLLMDDNAYFYICGSAGMALEVGKRVGEAVMRSLGWGEGELREWLEQMKKTHRWQEDVWG